jgi:hypothetical protein
MGTEKGAYRRTWADVRDGHVVKRPASMAAHHVEMAGENMAACKKATRLATVALVASAECANVSEQAVVVKAVGANTGVLVGACMSIVQRRVFASRRPWRTT